MWRFLIPKASSEQAAALGQGADYRAKSSLGEWKQGALTAERGQSYVVFSVRLSGRTRQGFTARIAPREQGDEGNLDHLKSTDKFQQNANPVSSGQHL